MRALAPVYALLAALAGCTDPAPRSPEQFARDTLLVDTHIDVPMRLELQPADLTGATEGDFDHARAVAGGLDAAFMSIYIPAAVDEAGGAAALADRLIDGVEALARNHPEHFALATCTRDIERTKRAGLIALPLGMENGAPIGGSLGALHHYFQRGVRYVTLTHSRQNHIADSSYDAFRRWQGLSPFGETLVRAMNDLGIMIDVSHVSDQAFWKVIELSRAPVIATHSSLRHFTPGFERNLSDEMVAALGQQGGVVQINFGSGFLTTAARDWEKGLQRARLAWQFTSEIADDDPRVPELTLQFRTQYRADNPYPRARLDDVLDHVDRAVLLAGIAGVGIGSDYDGVGDTLPEGLEDVSTYPNLVAGLRGRGYTDDEIALILGGNTLRVWRANETIAAAAGQPPRCAT